MRDLAGDRGRDEVREGRIRKKGRKGKDKLTSPQKQ